MVDSKINWEQYKQPIILNCKNWDEIPEHYMFYKELNRIRDILADFLINWQRTVKRMENLTSVMLEKCSFIKKCLK